jgi:hypothetical protein
MRMQSKASSVTDSLSKAVCSPKKRLWNCSEVGFFGCEKAPSKAESLERSIEVKI